MPHNVKKIKTERVKVEHCSPNSVQYNGDSDEDLFNQRITRIIRWRKSNGLRRLQNGQSKIITTASRGEFTVGLIKPGEQIFEFKKSWPEPVPSGYWLGWPEDEWGITEQEWQRMPLIEKARWEAREQLENWVYREYFMDWLDIYAPDVLDKLGMDKDDPEYEEAAKRVRAVRCIISLIKYAKGG